MARRRLRESLAETDERGRRYDVAFAAWRERPGGVLPAWAGRELDATCLGPAREPAPGDREAAQAFLLSLSDGDASRLGVSRQHEEAKARARAGGAS